MIYDIQIFDKSVFDYKIPINSQQIPINSDSYFVRNFLVTNKFSDTQNKQNSDS